MKAAVRLLQIHWIEFKMCLGKMNNCWTWKVAFFSGCPGLHTPESPIAHTSRLCLFHLHQCLLVTLTQLLHLHTLVKRHCTPTCSTACPSPTVSSSVGCNIATFAEQFGPVTSANDYFQLFFTDIVSTMLCNKPIYMPHKIHHLLITGSPRLSWRLL